MAARTEGNPLAFAYLGVFKGKKISLSSGKNKKEARRM